MRLADPCHPPGQASLPPLLRIWTAPQPRCSWTSMGQHKTEWTQSGKLVTGFSYMKAVAHTYAAAAWPQQVMNCSYWMLPKTVRVMLKHKTLSWCPSCGCHFVQDFRNLTQNSVTLPVCDTTVQIQLQAEHPTSALVAHSLLIESG